MNQMRGAESKGFGRSNSKSDRPSIWREILDEAKRTCEFLNSNMIILGRKDVGKSNMVKCLQRIGASAAANMNLEEYKDADGVSALDYAFLNVRNVDDDDPNEALAKCNLWILQSKDHKRLLMNHLLNPDVIKSLGFLICLDLSKPWNMKSDLKYWLDLVVEISAELHKMLPVDDLTDMKKKLSHYTNNYKNGVLKETAEVFAKRAIQAQQSAAEPISEEEASTLQLNLGFPIIICVCKSDAAQHLDTRATQGQIDVVQAHMRDIMFPYGAALCYCYCKDVDNHQNFDLLYRYMMHRLYNFEFSEPYLDESQETLFVPAGWDTKEAIMEFAKTTVANGLEKSYESMITRPTSDITGVQIEDSDAIDVEDLNAFLARALAQYPQVASNAPREARPPHTSRDTAKTQRERDTSIPTALKEAQKETAAADAVNENPQSGSESPSMGPKKLGSGEKGNAKRTTTPRSGLPPTATARKTHTARAEGSHTSRQAPVSARQQNGDKSLRNFFETLLNKGQSGNQKAPGDKSKPSG